MGTIAILVGAAALALLGLGVGLGWWVRGAYVRRGDAELRDQVARTIQAGLDAEIRQGALLAHRRGR